MRLSKSLRHMRSCFPTCHSLFRMTANQEKVLRAKGTFSGFQRCVNPLMQMICCFTLDTTDPFNLGCISTHVWSRIDRGEKINSNPASFTHDRLVQHVEEINATSRDLKLEGFMSLVGARSKVRTPVCTTPCDSRHNDRLISICVSMK
jgi:hypothetical protein